MIVSGWARISNVEFAQMGQEGWSDFFDPRYALAFLDIGDMEENKPSYVRRCSFHDNYNSAFGAFGSNALPFQDNVVYRTVGNSKKRQLTFFLFMFNFTLSVTSQTSLNYAYTCQCLLCCSSQAYASGTAIT